jgi:Uma2 family endonuclease
MSSRLRKTDAGRRPYRLTADQLGRMLEAGIIPEGNDIELLGGVLYKMVKKEPHNFTVGQVADALRRLLPDGFHVREEKSLRQGKRSLPEPDVVVAVGRSGDYRPQPPSTSEVPLIVEVCHHTQKADFQDKYRRYAAAGVPVYWIVDLHHRRVEVFTGPVGQSAVASYSAGFAYPEGGTVPVLLLGEQIGVIQVADLLPPSASTS